MEKRGEKRARRRRRRERKVRVKAERETERGEEGKRKGADQELCDPSLGNTLQLCTSCVLMCV